ncbi:MAG: hypothetical protein RLZZ450_1219 [Pseudomonadota bacterium]
MRVRWTDWLKNDRDSDAVVAFVPGSVVAVGIRRTGEEGVLAEAGCPESHLALQGILSVHTTDRRLQGQWPGTLQVGTRLANVELALGSAAQLVDFPQPDRDLALRLVFGQDGSFDGGSMQTMAGWPVAVFEALD